MKIYLDNCCYNRPFDDQTQERIHLESEAILTILKRGQTGLYHIVGSDILELEMERMHDIAKRYQVKELYKVADQRILYSEKIKIRSQKIMQQSKIRTFDSLHIAAAEMAQADVMLTTDDKLEKMAARLELEVKVMNPLKFAWEAI
ncbi:MAG: PIN domain-containing protein [Eubacteriales bacterium]|nr:PIN domain-containing protein [Eubacteriales bacterium]